MASTSASRRTARAPAAPAVLPDEILEEIFLRLDAAADLARVSATSSSFRCIVSARRFLRRFRSLHSPAVLGFINRSANGNQRFLPVGPPHRSAPEARALVEAADFTFSFLPGARALVQAADSFLLDPHAWRFRHARDGRILLSRTRRISTKIRFEELLVCDPLHRRYVKIPRIPDDLVATSTPRHLSPVLVPAAENDAEESFRVICAVPCKDKVMASVFSSCNQTWRGIVIVSTISLPNGNGNIEYMPFYAHGCLYWMFYRMAYSLMLDTSEMKFSVIDLPPHNFYSIRAIAEAADGRLGFSTIADGVIDLYCKDWQSNGAAGAQEWLHSRLIPLPKVSINCRWHVQGTAGRYLALVAHHVTFDELPPDSEHFVLDMKTLLVEKLYTSNKGAFYGFPYVGFPPLLALPSI